MRTTILLLFVILFRVNSFADGFYGVHSPNGNDVWAVGKAGSIYRSFDGGSTWGSYPAGVLDLRAVHSSGTNVWIVGDAGTYYRSTDTGANFASATINGGLALYGIVFVNETNGWACGKTGTIIVTTDGGATWNPQTSGTAQDLFSIAFVDSLTGYASGAAGVLLKTTNGGATWTSTAAGGWTANILGVAAKGSSVYAVGADGFSYKSTNGGANWALLSKFYTDSRSDVTGVYALSSDSALFIGGGGFIRKTGNGGISTTWGVHGMHASLSDIHMYDSQKGWACSDKNNAVMRTTDGGATWLLPTGTTVDYTWVQKTSNGSIGNTFMVNPWNKNYIYQVSGTVVRMSADRGDTWQITDTISGGGSTWSFYISPKDTNIWIAATDGTGDGVRRTTNRGATWTTTLSRPFTSYGMPLEMDPDHPDTVLFAADQTGGGQNAVVYISTDFGATWDTLSTTFFRSPCDVVIVPDSANIVYIGDGTTGSNEGIMWRSTDGGATWDTMYTNTAGVSEIPMIATSRMRNTESYSTGWGGGGFRKSTNTGLTWPSLTTSGSTWGTDVAKDDPNVVLYGLYGGGISYLSTNAGSSFYAKALSGSNSGMLCYDRATFLVHQAGNGIWKYVITYTVPTSNTQAVGVTAPNGGETWAYNSVHNITWTSSNISNAKIEYKTSAGGSWQTIAASVPASTLSYAWTVPNAPSTQCKVRVSDAADATPQDSSNAVFTISASAISSTPASLAFGTVTVGLTKQDTVRIYNTGTGTLVVSSVTASNANFTPGRTSFSITAGNSDTLSVTYAPSGSGSVLDTLIVANNSPTGTYAVPLSGDGVYAIPQPISPPNASTERPIADTLKWNTVPAALTYHLQMAPDSGFGSPVFDDSTLTGTTQPMNLPLLTTYYWRVNAVTGGGPTAWSDIWHFTTTATTTLQSSLSDGWNMISVPLIVSDGRREILYSTSTSNAFSYGPSGYSAQDTLNNGIGYWLKFDSAQNINMTGEIRPVDTIAVGAGWNMIGSLSSSIPANTITEIPSGILQSAFYGYNGSYAVADTLEPSKAYWVKSSTAGQLILGSGAAPAVSVKANHKGTKAQKDTKKD